MQDSELQNLIDKERKHYLGVIDLIAASNAPTQFVRDNRNWSVGQFRSAEGNIGKRPYAGTRNFDAIESLAARRGCELFHSEHCNVQPISGSLANISVYKALLRPGDTILSMSMQSGAHLTHGLEAHLIKDLYRVTNYHVDPSSCLLDYDQIRELAKHARPQLIIAGYSAYPRQIDFSQFHAIANEVGAYVMADIAHIAGLVATGLHPNPNDEGLIVTSSIEKTLRGTRGGFILCPADLANRIDRGVFPGVQSSIGLGSLITKARLFLEAKSTEFNIYQRAVLDNARLMSNILIDYGLSVLTGGTDTHMMILNVSENGLTGRSAERRLESVGILTNRNLIPYDPLPPFETSGLRLGTPTVTARGFTSDEIEQLSRWIGEILTSKDWTERTQRSCRRDINQLIQRDRPTDVLRDLVTG